MGGKPVTNGMSWRGVRRSEERLDASDPQKPPPMNYSATSTITFFLFSLLVSGPGRPLSLKGMRGNPTGIDTPALLFYNFYLSQLRRISDASRSPRE